MRRATSTNGASPATSQDQWRLGGALTLNLGLRYDPRAIPTLDKAAALVDLAQSTGFTPITEAFSRNPTLNNWEPRVGVAFDPSAISKTSIRAGYGIFHSPITANRLGPAYALNPPFALGVQVRLAVPAVPGLPDAEPGRVADFADAGARLRHGATRRACISGTSTCSASLLKRPA